MDKEKTPLILVTNDDGINSPGLKAAVETAALIGDVLVAAPHTQQTGMGRAFPRTKETGIIEKADVGTTYVQPYNKQCQNSAGHSVRAYAVHGSPSLAVAHGVLELCERKPDLCISGINYGENLGTTLTCSGTFGAALEANSHGIPSIAISVAADLAVQRSDDYAEADWEAAKEVLRVFIERILENNTMDFPKKEKVDVWNINVPSEMKKPYRYRITTQSRQSYFPFVKPDKRDYTRPFRLKSRLYVHMETLEKDSDIYAVYEDHVISATPLCMTMTQGRILNQAALPVDISLG